MTVPKDQPKRSVTARSIPGMIVERRFAPAPRTNADRVAEVDVLMRAFYAMTGVDPDPSADGPETALSDLLAHLLHYAEANDLNFSECLLRATAHYKDEADNDSA